MTDPKTYIRIVVETKPDNLMDGKEVKIRKNHLTYFVDMKDRGDRDDNILFASNTVKMLNNPNYENE